MIIGKTEKLSNLDFTKYEDSKVCLEILLSKKLHQIETSHLTCNADQLIGFYMIQVVTELNANNIFLMMRISKGFSEVLRHEAPIF